MTDGYITKYSCLGLSSVLPKISSLTNKKKLNLTKTKISFSQLQKSS